MMSSLGPASVTVAAKLPRVLADGLGRLAADRGTTMSAMIRELAEAALDGTLSLPTPEEVDERDAERTRLRRVEALRRAVEFERSRPKTPPRLSVLEMYTETRRRGIRTG